MLLKNVEPMKDKYFPSENIIERPQGQKIEINGNKGEIIM